MDCSALAAGCSFSFDRGLDWRASRLVVVFGRGWSALFFDFSILEQLFVMAGFIALHTTALLLGQDQVVRLILLSVHCRVLVNRA